MVEKQTKFLNMLAGFNPWQCTFYNLLDQVPIYYNINNVLNLVEVSYHG